VNGDLWTLPKAAGPDFDFGAGPNLFTAVNPVTGRLERLLGAGQKSGVYWAVDPATGKVVLADPGRPGGQRRPWWHRVRHSNRRASYLRGRG
jgi:polyvinyl alcohol dehydrogenase (cytochrome)